RLGLQAMGNDGYFDDYHLTSTAVDTAKSTLELERAGAKSSLVLGKDYFLFGSAVAALDVSGAVVFVGHGAKEDYQGVDVKGAWALATVSRDVPSPERTRQARAAGAIGLISVPDPAQDEPNWGGMEAKRTVVEGSEPEGSAGAGIALVWLSRASTT